MGKFFTIKKKVITSGCSYNNVKENGKVYLIRWELFESKKVAFYLHKFLSSDPENLHDHPWNFISIILWRGYKEEYFIGNLDYNTPIHKTRRVWPFTVIYRKATHRHRVLLINEKPALTLVIRFKYIRYWGFWVRNKWKLFSEYFNSNDC